jgi:RNA recognition motif-containing protein
MRFRIDNLPIHTTEHELRQLFSGYGNVLSVKLLPCPLDSKQYGSGLIEIESTKIAGTGVFSDRCLFRGRVLRITQDRGATENRTPENPAAPGDPNKPDMRRPDNRGKNVLQVTSVEEVVDPATEKPNGWCRYSIQSLSGSVTGLRHGSVADVTLYAEEAAEAFNQRNMLGQRRPPIWTSRHKK